MSTIYLVFLIPYRLHLSLRKKRRRTWSRSDSSDVAANKHRLRSFHFCDCPPVTRHRDSDRSATRNRKRGNEEDAENEMKFLVCSGNICTCKQFQRSANESRTISSDVPREHRLPNRWLNNSFEEFVISRRSDNLSKS